LSWTLLAATITVRPAGRQGFDVLVDGKRVAPVRLCSNGAIVASQVESGEGTSRFTGLRCRDPLAASFAPEDYVSVAVPPPKAAADVVPDPASSSEPQVRFQSTLRRFDAAR
jgi:hypothetical protein